MPNQGLCSFTCCMILTHVARLLVSGSEKRSQVAAHHLSPEAASHRSPASGSRASRRARACSCRGGRGPERAPRAAGTRRSWSPRPATCWSHRSSTPGNLERTAGPCGEDGEGGTAKELTLRLHGLLVHGPRLAAQVLVSAVDPHVHDLDPVVRLLQGVVFFGDLLLEGRHKLGPSRHRAGLPLALETIRGSSDILFIHANLLIIKPLSH